MTTVHVVCAGCDAVNRLPAERLQAGGKCGKCGRPLFIGKPVALNARRLRTHLKRSDLPLLVDFWAEWCGPCKMMAPAFEQAAARLEPRARLIKIDTDANQELATELGIRGIPTLILFKGGREQARKAGAADLQGLVNWVSPYL